jgi:flagellar biosynthesis/type III secretory pathway protein FliH
LSRSKVVKRGLQYDVPLEVVAAVKGAAGDKAAFRPSEAAEAMEAMLRNTERECDGVREEAARDAEGIISAAWAEAGALRERAEREGFEAGLVRGAAEAEAMVRAEAEASLSEIKSLAEMIRAERAQALEREEMELVCIALEAAKKIMKQQCRVNAGAVSEMLEEAIAENEGVIKVYLSEFQHALELQLDKNITKKIRAFAKGMGAVIVKEPDSIMLESETGIVDVSVPTQLELLRESLMEGAEEGHGRQ